MITGLLQKAGETKQTVNKAEIEEKVKLAYQDYYIGQNTETEYTFQQALDKIFGEGEITVTESKGVYTLSIENGKKYSFNPETKEFSEIIWTQNEATITNIQTGETLKVGDTVYYDSGVEDYEGEEIKGKWGILGAEYGKLLIMSKENVASVTLSGKQDYLTDGTIKLNNACTPFKNEKYADSARSIKIEDIDRIKTLGLTETPHVFTMTSDGYVKMDDGAPSTWNKTFINLDGRKLPEDSPIYINSTFGGGYLRIDGKAWNNLLNPNSGDYWLNTQFTRCIGITYWGYYVITGHNISNQSNNVLYTSSGGGFGSQGVRAVVVLKSNVRLSGNSTDGWTLNNK